MSEANAAGRTMSRTVVGAPMGPDGWAGPLPSIHLRAVISTKGGSVTTLGLPATGLVWTTKVAVSAPGWIATLAWLQASLAPSVVRPETFAGYPVDYGYLWWLFPLTGRGPTGNPDATVYAAAGIFGQYIFVIPKLDLVVVVTGGTQDHDAPVRFLYSDILPAIQ